MLVIRSTVLLSSVVTVLFSSFHNSCVTIAFQNNVDTRCHQRTTTSIIWSAQYSPRSAEGKRLKSSSCNTNSYMTKKYINDNDDDDDDDNDKLKKHHHRLKVPKKDDEPKKQQLAALPSFIDAMFEIPDPKLLAGELLFILMINFLLQIADEVGEPNFWYSGGFSQPMTLSSTSLLDVIDRDSKMSISWILGALRQRSYSTSSVADDGTAIKVAVQVWVDYCSLRILLELGESLLFTHSTISLWLIGREVWYTLIVMTFFRWAYSRFR